MFSTSCQCLPCASGSWLSEPNNALECNKCATCNENQYISSPCTLTSNTVCSQCHICAAHEWQEQACTNSTNTICKPCGSCKESYYISSPCTKTSDVQCSSCATCKTNEYIDTPCSGENNTVCKSCSSCSNDEFMVSPCTSIANTVCTNCSSYCSSQNSPLLECTPNLATCGDAWKTTVVNRCLSGVWNFEDNRTNPGVDFGEYRFIKAPQTQTLIDTYYIYNVDHVKNMKTDLYIKDGSSINPAQAASGQPDGYMVADVSTDHGKTFSSVLWPISLGGKCLITKDNNTCEKVQKDCKYIIVNDKYNFHVLSYTEKQL